MPDKVSPEALAEVQHAINEYREKIEDARNSGHLHGNTCRTYLRGAESFVRWLSGEYEPGIRLKQRGTREKLLHSNRLP